MEISLAIASLSKVYSQIRPISRLQRGRAKKPRTNRETRKLGSYLPQTQHARTQTPSSSFPQSSTTHPTRQEQRCARATGFCSRPHAGIPESLRKKNQETKKSKKDFLAQQTQIRSFIDTSLSVLPTPPLPSIPVCIIAVELLLLRPTLAATAEDLEEGWLPDEPGRWCLLALPLLEREWTMCCVTGLWPLVGSMVGALLGGREAGVRFC